MARIYPLRGAARSGLSFRQPIGTRMGQDRRAWGAQRLKAVVPLSAAGARFAFPDNRVTRFLVKVAPPSRLHAAKRNRGSEGCRLPGLTLSQTVIGEGA